MAHLRYSLFEEVAHKEGFTKAAEFFSEAKQEEKGHAKLWYSLLNGGQVPTTKENLEYQIQKENEEWTDKENSYTYMAEIAEKEGFADIAKHFRAVASEEEAHEDHLSELLTDALHDHTCNCGLGHCCCGEDCDCEKECECGDCDCEECDCDKECECGENCECGDSCDCHDDTCCCCDEEK